MLGLGGRSDTLQAASAVTMRESQPPVKPQLTRFLAPPVQALAAVMLLSGCLSGPAKRDTAQQAAPLPTLDLKATVTVLDAETGEPIPDAWVLLVARVTTDRPAPSGHLEAAAGARSITGPQGTASIHKVEGTYYPGEPKGKAWHVMELSRTERLGPMKLTGIQGGSLVIASAKYGFAHQPFVVEDDPSFQEWLRKNRREDYNGWLGRDTMRKQLPLLSVRSKDIKTGVALTIKMRRPAGLDEWASMISPVVFWGSTWVGMAKDAGATEDEQRRIYWLFARQLDQVGLMSGKMEHVESFADYLREETIKLYLNHGRKNADRQGAIQLWLARKALEVLPPDAAEVKEHVGAILKGVEEEGRDPRWQYHYLSPSDPAVGLPGFDSALRWAGLDQDNAKNEWDWQDAQRYYRAGDREKAYLALGHVLRLLANLAIPKFTAADQTHRTAFEEAIEGVLAANRGSLPPEYWHSVREPAFALTPGVRFQAVAGGQRNARQGMLEVRGAAVMSDAVNDVGGANQGLAMARITFPQAIAHGAGLLSDFHRLMHPAAHVQLPGNGNGNGEGVRQSSGTDRGSMTDAAGASERARKAGAALAGTGLKSEAGSNTQSLTPNSQNFVVPDEIDLRLLAPSEIEFLRTNCTETSQLIPSGSAIVYGHVLTPPILVSTNRDRIYLNGIQVVPREERAKNQLAQKYVNRLHAQYQWEKMSGTKDPLPKVLERAGRMAKAGQIEGYSMLEGDILRLSIRVAGTEAHKAIDYCPAPTNAKRYFIIEQLLWNYTLRKQAGGPEPALAWLRERFEDLKRMGILSIYRMHDDEETVFTRADCSLTDFAFGFYDPRTKYAREGEKAWKERKPEADTQRSGIIQALTADKLVIFSHAFEKSLPQDPDLLREIEQIHRTGASADTSKLRNRMGLSPEQAVEFLDEVR